MDFGSKWEIPVLLSPPRSLLALFVGITLDAADDVIAINFDSMSRPVCRICVRLDTRNVRPFFRPSRSCRKGRQQARPFVSSKSFPSFNRTHVSATRPLEGPLNNSCFIAAGARHRNAPARAIYRPSELAFCVGDNSIWRGCAACIITGTVVALKVIVCACNSRREQSLGERETSREHNCAEDSARMRFAFLRRRACADPAARDQGEERQRNNRLFLPLKMSTVTLSQTTSTASLAICPFTAALSLHSLQTTLASAQRRQKCTERTAKGQMLGLFTYRLVITEFPP